MRVGKTPYGKKWHIIGKDDIPLCGYVSFNWVLGEKDTVYVDARELKNYDMCRGCMKKLNNGRK